MRHTTQGPATNSTITTHDRGGTRSAKIEHSEMVAMYNPMGNPNSAPRLKTLFRSSITTSSLV